MINVKNNKNKFVKHFYKIIVIQTIKLKKDNKIDIKK